MILGSIALGSLSPAVGAAGWPQYRGPTYNGVSADRIRTDWTGAVTNPVWRVLLTNGLSSLSIAEGRLFTQTQVTVDGTNREACVALDAATGQRLWTRPLDIADYPGGGVGFDDGPRTTPACEGDSVYVLTSYMKLYRLRAADGTIVWQRDLTVLYGSLIILWQNAASPRLENGIIYLNSSAKNQSLMALRTSDGGLIWRSQTEGLTHSTPVLADIHDVHQLIFATQSGLVSVNPTNGVLLWKHPYPFRYSESLGASPVVYEDMVFVCGAHAYGMGSMTIQATVTSNVWTTHLLWSTNNPSSHWMTPVCQDGFLYGQFGIQGFDSVRAQLKCVDLRTGQERWSTNGFGRGATLLVDHRLVILAETNHLVLAEANPSAYIQLGRFVALPYWNGNTNKSWNSPALCDGRLYVRSTSYVACFDLSINELTLDPPRPSGPDRLDLNVRTRTGAPIPADRVEGLQLFGTDQADQPLAQWFLLTNSPILNEGNLLYQNGAR